MALIRLNENICTHNSSCSEQCLAISKESIVRRNFDVADTAAQDFPLYQPFVELLQSKFNTNIVQRLSLVLLQLTFVLAHQM